jgi:hypothetical protein
MFGMELGKDLAVQVGLMAKLDYKRGEQALSVLLFVVSKVTIEKSQRS